MSEIHQLWQRHLGESFVSERDTWFFLSEHVVLSGFSMEKASLDDHFLRHAFKVNNPSILHGRRVATFSKWRGRALVPTAARSGEHIHILHFRDELHFIVLRPCAGKYIEKTDETILKQKLFNRAAGDEMKVEHFCYIGMVWVEAHARLMSIWDGEYLGSKNGLHECIVALH